MSPRTPYRILAIDDVASNLLTLRAILPADEFTVRGASGAEDAFRLLAEYEFDLVLLDVVMPGVDGFSIARRLRADARTALVPVIFLTALTDEDQVVQGFEAGGVDFVSKPFRKSELLLRVRTHLALKDRNEELQRANGARDRFFSILAHDLKGPLAGFESLIRGLLSQFPQLERDEIFETLVALGQTAQNVARLLDTLLDWGRSQTGGLALAPEVCSLPLLVEEAFEPLEASFRQKELVLENRVESDYVYVDHGTTVTIFRNLLSNSLKFTGAGGRVTVTSRPVDQGIETAVADTGVGIPEARLLQLFQLDSKQSTLGTEREPGTGLGLVLCREFAERNHGSLRAESQPGQGSTFFLVLPAVAV